MFFFFVIKPIHSSLRSESEIREIYNGPSSSSSSSSSFTIVVGIIYYVFYYVRETDLRPGDGLFGRTRPAAVWFGARLPRRLRRRHNIILPSRTARLIVLRYRVTGREERGDPDDDDGTFFFFFPPRRTRKMEINK